MAFDFTGQTILVTGASRGIGRELTKALIKAGAVVYGLARNKDLLDTLQQECGEHFKPIVVDLSDWDATKTAVDALPVMDGLVNNAGMLNPRVSSLEADRAVLERTLNVNLLAVINVTQVVASKMVAAGKKGSIVNISSVAGLSAVPGYLAYNMSKAALEMVTKQFAAELGPNNIRVNSVNPTTTVTDMVRSLWKNPSAGGEYLGHTPLGRFAEVEEVVGPILYLLSSYSSMVTGTTHPVEGGLLCYIKTG